MAWRELAKMVGTPNCMQTAMALVSECARVFPIDPLICTVKDADSFGFFSAFFLSVFLKLCLALDHFPMLKFKVARTDTLKLA